MCGSETCEQDADCGGGQTCQACQCMNPSACASGIGLVKPRTALRVANGRITVRGDAVIPEPWQSIDPPANGIRVVVDSPSGPGGFDVVVSPGGAWTAGTRRWVYRDPLGSVGGITKVVVQDRRLRQAGLVRVVVKGRGATLALPDPAAVRTTIVVGTAAECASVAWNGPDEPAPRCRGDAARLVCK